MLSSKLSKIIKSYQDFPKEGILFRDALPVLQDPEVFNEVIIQMSESNICTSADAILAIDARGFLFGTGIALKLKKPIVVARKPGKLPGEIKEKSYELEYGKNSLSIQKEVLNKYQSFAIIDDLLATGGTVKCVSDILLETGKEILGLSVLIELSQLEGRSKFNFPVESQISF